MALYLESMEKLSLRHAESYPRLVAEPRGLATLDRYLAEHAAHLEGLLCSLPQSRHGRLGMAYQPGGNTATGSGVLGTLAIGGSGVQSQCGRLATLGAVHVDA
jgi:hypothetical protein